MAIWLAERIIELLNGMSAALSKRLRRAKLLRDFHALDRWIDAHEDEVDAEMMRRY